MSISVIVTAVVMFFLGALTSALVICLCYNPRRLKAPQTSTSTSGTTSALPPGGPVYEYLKDGGGRDGADGLVAKGNEAYGHGAERIEMGENAAYVDGAKLMEVKENVAYEPHTEHLAARQDDAVYERVDL